MSLSSFLNPHVAAIQPYEPGRPIEEVARELGLAPETIIKLASNESPLGASPKAVTALRKHAEDVWLYPDGGAWVLRNALADKYDLPFEQVAVGNGSNEILELVGHCFLNPQSSVVFSAHSFVVYKLVSVLFGAQQLEVPMRDGLELDLDGMLATIRDDTRVVFVCNPNNPTGTMRDAADIEAFVKAVPEDVLVVVDEAYAEIALRPMPNTIPLIASHPNLLVTRTFSKAYGLAGLRLGYGLAQPELIKMLQQARQPFNVNLPAQYAGTAALEDESFVADVRQACEQGKVQIEAGCREFGLSFIPGYANFMLIKVGDGAGITRALQEKGVIVRPMGGYQLPDYIRVTFGTNAQNERFLSTLKEVLSL